LEKRRRRAIRGKKGPSSEQEKFDRSWCGTLVEGDPKLFLTRRRGEAWRRSSKKQWGKAGGLRSDVGRGFRKGGIGILGHYVGKGRINVDWISKGGGGALQQYQQIRNGSIGGK